MKRYIVPIETSIAVYADDEEQAHFKAVNELIHAATSSEDNCTAELVENSITSNDMPIIEDKEHKEKGHDDINCANDMVDSNGDMIEINAE